MLRPLLPEVESTWRVGEVNTPDKDISVGDVYRLKTLPEEENHHGDRCVCAHWMHPNINKVKIIEVNWEEVKESPVHLAEVVDRDGSLGVIGRDQIETQGGVGVEDQCIEPV